LKTKGASERLITMKNAIISLLTVLLLGCTTRVHREELPPPSVVVTSNPPGASIYLILDSETYIGTAPVSVPLSTTRLPMLKAQINGETMSELVSSTYPVHFDFLKDSSFRILLGQKLADVFKREGFYTGKLIGVQGRVITARESDNGTFFMLSTREGFIVVGNIRAKNVSSVVMGNTIRILGRVLTVSHAGGKESIAMDALAIKSPEGFAWIGEAEETAKKWKDGTLFFGSGGAVSQSATNI
jgi:hypothetical protein